MLMGGMASTNPLVEMVMLKCRSFAAAVVGALLLFPGIAAADSFDDAFDAAVADAGFSDFPDFDSAVADAGFDGLEEKRDALEQALEDEHDSLLEALEDDVAALTAHFEEFLAGLIAKRDELGATEPGPDDFVLEDKPGGVIDCTDGICQSPED